MLTSKLLFFIMVVTLFPLGVSPEVAFLKQSGAGILWVAALLSVLLSLDHLFRHDFDDGTLEQLVLQPQPLFLLVLGCFLDGISLILLVTSIIMPVIETAGFDLIWFGIYLVIVVEMSQITPPVGFNLFVIQGLTGKDILTITKATLPFFLLMLVAVALLHLFPSIGMKWRQMIMVPLPLLFCREVNMKWV
mgnify:CR=1 FL=1